MCRLSGGQLGWLSRELAEELATIPNINGRIDVEMSDLTAVGAVFYNLQEVFCLLKYNAAFHTLQNSKYPVII